MSSLPTKSEMTNKIFDAMSDAVNAYFAEKHAELIIHWTAYKTRCDAEKEQNAKWSSMPKMTYGKCTVKDTNLNFVAKITGGMAFLAEFGKGQFYPLQVPERARVYYVKSHKRSRRNDGTVHTNVNDNNISIKRYSRKVTRHAYTPHYVDTSGHTVNRRVGVDSYIMNKSPMFTAYRGSGLYKKNRWYDPSVGSNFFQGNSKVKLNNALKADIKTNKGKTVSLHTDYMKGFKVWSHNGGYYIWKAFGIDMQDSISKEHVVLTSASKSRVKPFRSRSENVKSIPNPNKKLLKKVSDAVKKCVNDILKS